MFCKILEMLFIIILNSIQLKNKLGGDRITLKVREFSTHEESKKISEILSSIDGISQVIINKAQGYSINFVVDKEKDLLTKLKSFI